MSAFRSAQPFEKTADFVNAVGAKFGQPFVESWLSPRTCRFSADRVFTIGLAVDRLNLACSEIAKRCGVTMEHCPDITAGFYREHETKQAAKGKVRQ